MLLQWPWQRSNWFSWWMYKLKKWRCSDFILCLPSSIHLRCPQVWYGTPGPNSLKTICLFRWNPLISIEKFYCCCDLEAWNLYKAIEVAQVDHWSPGAIWFWNQEQPWEKGWRRLIFGDFYGSFGQPTLELLLQKSVFGWVGCGWSDRGSPR